MMIAIAIVIKIMIAIIVWVIASVGLNVIALVLEMIFIRANEGIVVTSIIAMVMA